MLEFLKKIILVSCLFCLYGTLLAQQAPEINENSASSISGLTNKFHLDKRNELRSKLPDRSVALFFSSSEKVRSNDVFFDFHQDPKFYYLTGFKEPDALLIIFKEAFEVNGKSIKEMIFVPGRSKSFEMWNGVRLGTAGVMGELELELAKVNTEFADFDLDFSYFDHIFFNQADGAFHDDPQNRGDISSMLKHFHLKTDTLEDKKNEVRLKSQLAYMREIKSEEELVLMRKAIEVTCESQKTLMRQIDSTFTEYKAEALIEYVFRNEGTTGPAFPSIVGGGENSCTLHYISNNEDLNNGDLLVVDVGAEFQEYAADVTRTIPVNGKFTKEQTEIYNLVLRAQNAGIKACVKGKKFWDPGVAATAEIQKGLIKLGIIKKSYQSKKYFMHGTSHYLGLDVHDLGTNEPLKPGNVITVEPGIYIPEGSDCDKKWWNIGVRIEDDILITNDIPINLSKCVPREIGEIEALMLENK